jgi:hypothetical protein
MRSCRGRRRNTMKPKELCRGRRSVLFLVLSITLCTIVSSGSTGADVATLSQYDPEWPLDGRTAFALTIPANAPLVIEQLSWRGEFYRGEPVPIAGFQTRAYRDADGNPGTLLAEVGIGEFTRQNIGGNAFAYSAELTQPVALPAGTRVWLEIQAESPAIPQWGVLGIDSPETDDSRLMRCPTLGILRWSYFDWFEGQPGGSSPLEHDYPGVKPEGSLPQPLIYPNPAFGGLSVIFSLEQAAHVKAVVYDVGGRIVRELVDSDLEVGRHEVKWDGLTNQGNTSGSGIYFIEVQAKSETLVRDKVLLMR